MVKKETKSSKPRRFYSRRGIVHICFAGSHWAPQDGKTTEFRTDKPVTRVAVAADGESLTVSQSINRKKATSETWVTVIIPRKKRVSKVEKFRAAAYTQLTRQLTGGAIAA